MLHCATKWATPKPSHNKQSSACPVLGDLSIRGIPRLCPSNSEAGACNPCFEAQNGRPRKHPGTTPGRSNSPKIDIRPTGFNMTGFGCPRLRGGDKVVSGGWQNCAFLLLLLVTVSGVLLLLIVGCVCVCVYFFFVPVNMGQSGSECICHAYSWPPLPPSATPHHD